uniref:Uncharacterized protein n=1 Tax=Gopherus evgoodei TaxID=1825980 RepID=A0A8C4XVW6_9SAUR
FSLLVFFSPCLPQAGLLPAVCWLAPGPREQTAAFPVPSSVANTSEIESALTVVRYF